MHLEFTAAWVYNIVVCIFDHIADTLSSMFFVIFLACPSIEECYIFPTLEVLWCAQENVDSNPSYDAGLHW